MADLKGALIGCGFFAVNQMHGWRDAEGARIVAICDRDPERLRAVGDEFGITRRYLSVDDLFADGGFDFVDIATTVGSHRSLVELAARHGIATICQKPIAPTMEDAEAMVEACAKAGVPFMVHENFRWQSPIRAVKAAIDSGTVGEVFWGRVSFRSGYDVFSGQPYLATGKRFIIEDLGIHALDVARYIFGDATAVTARTRRVNPAIAGEDVATMLLDHAGAITSIVDCSYATRLPIEPFPETLIEVDGSKGTLRLSQGYHLTMHSKDGTKVTNVEPPVLSWAAPPWHNIQESVSRIQQHWVEALRAGREPDTSGLDNLETFALVEASYLSAAEGRTVSLAEVIGRRPSQFSR
ncbi:gfo/Idh/MocA family oxidoreductase [Sinorhizobium medicae]|uniref:Gfo/Idh/MocA family protein n=1 Tax=Sinorhizobium medicae TaxID=110321 RepID=UPI00042A43C5|nr:Gfo/Idh/MocA family oxidoreductase [Sinorhizobium medicae]MDX0455049.1 gfo/Idh/MocA family oxidoreductase [Sinorhizobium medicae]MDX0514341.1 gfo/Idh/MocA family oxidoreductase [Sinorhizobium medicae]MDX0725328.1 gfo/Idh/MocA family oxidoreductase [Sinorhizobium medicae]MDX0731314.1 gfo/Idh/MocA family oxidoreductase [Sinorhizobium medicae]MDX0811297.1 gfo/Idh/MocA family oxidoreductase [Sinorhizobium medicae]